MKSKKSNVTERNLIRALDLDALAHQRAGFEKDLDAFVDAVGRLEKHWNGATECADPRHVGYCAHTYRLMSARRRLAEVLDLLPDLDRV
jgi:hypothetical protein